MHQKQFFLPAFSLLPSPPEDEREPSLVFCCVNRLIYISAQVNHSRFLRSKFSRRSTATKDLTATHRLPSRYLRAVPPACRQNSVCQWQCVRFSGSHLRSCNQANWNRH